ncbi:hypothetical protein E3N88_21042 [Mikania micrantha]|uniref:25S rRNA (uridine-N(3))-methyltransferase BMT5-like domain-containing protein n=1 Tax=Mikania micrantha TaxID=192012 RepID=A0A5N6NK47_9ASTR|nr:hypothetical protein E3N88_21042 [Mikania micrantha]
MYSHQPGSPQQQPEEEPEEGGKDVIPELYNTSQKILIACLEDFTVACEIASKLGDATNIVVMSPYSCGEMKRLYENARSQMLDLSKLGATIVFDADFHKFHEDSRINHTRYDRIILV